MKKIYSIKVLPIILVFSGILCGLLQSSLDVPILAFISFSPMMYALQKAEGKREFLYSFGEFFLPYYFTQTVFLVEAGKSAPFSHILAGFLLLLGSIALTLLLSVLTFIPTYMIRWLPRSPLTDMPFIAALITMGDFLAQHLPVLAFPWSSVALSLTGMPLMLQSANLFGSLFVSFFVLLCNGLLVQLFTAEKKLKNAVILCAAVGLNFAYGCFSQYHAEKIKSENENKTIKAMCVQDNAEGDEKAKIPPIDACNSYLEIIGRNYTDDISLIILPETPILEGYDENLNAFRYLKYFAENNNCTIISGCFLREEKSYNSQYAIRPDGSISNFYCKQVLVPFGEHNPFAFITGKHTLSPAKDKEKLMPLDCRNFRVGCAICIESIFPAISRNHAKAGADILCVSTNDSWFGNSGGRKQHFRHCILRSIENSKYLVRAGNCGISAIISPTGKVLAENSTKNKGVAKAEVQTISQKSFYTAAGNIYIAFPAILTVLAIVRRYQNYRGKLKTKNQV